LISWCMTGWCACAIGGVDRKKRASPTVKPRFTPHSDCDA
jgi:hypothetical protein